MFGNGFGQRCACGGSGGSGAGRGSDYGRKRWRRLPEPQKVPRRPGLFPVLLLVILQPLQSLSVMTVMTCWSSWSGNRLLQIGTPFKQRKILLSPISSPTRGDTMHLARRITATARSGQSKAMQFRRAVDLRNSVISFVAMGWRLFLSTCGQSESHFAEESSIILQSFIWCSGRSNFTCFLSASQLYPPVSTSPLRSLGWFFMSVYPIIWPVIS